MRNKNLIGIIYGFVHFSVEVTSFYFLYSRINSDPSVWIYALFFDALAFLPQEVLGALTDRYRKFNIGLLGSVFMLVSLVVKVDLFALALLSLGNAMIHISGAQHTLRDTKGKITPNALFVGAGSFGVITGQLLGNLSSTWIVAIPVILMALSVYAMLFVHKNNDISDKTADFNIVAKKSPLLIVALAFISVVVRGYIAYAIPTEWNKTVVEAVTLFVFMGAGKSIGGVLCDKIGYKKVSYLSLLLGLPFLISGNNNMALSLIGVALFSMTMPVSVAALTSVFPTRPGFAFGITTVGLFFGTAPAFFIRPQSLIEHQVVAVVLTVIALISLNLCIEKGK